MCFGVDPERTLNHGYFPPAAHLAVKDSIIPINVALMRAVAVTVERCLLPSYSECTTTCTGIGLKAEAVVAKLV